MSRIIKKLSHKYQFLELELEDTEEQAEEYATIFNRYFGKYFIDKNAEMWVNEETGEVRDQPPSEQEKIKKRNKPEKLKKIYKMLSKYLHPDKGGTDETFSELKQAYDYNDLLSLVKIAGNNNIEIEVSEEDIELAEKSINRLQKSIVNFQNTLAWHFCTGDKNKKIAVLHSVEKETGIKIKKEDYPEELL
tara:strand:- start:4603 stop:5175 length:573 start_codon:yes stop_codon:yes gene_type:complete